MVYKTSGCMAWLGIAWLDIDVLHFIYFSVGKPDRQSGRLLRAKYKSLANPSRAPFKRSTGVVTSPPAPGCAGPF